MNTQRIYKVLLLLVLCNFSCTACKDKIIQLSLDKKNPVEYIFNISRDSLHNIILKQFHLKGLIIWDATHKHMVIDEISKLFSLQENNFDFFLEQMDFTKKSKLFFKENGDSLVYIVSFYLHLDASNENMTKIRINTIDPKISIGLELLPKPPHFVRNNKTISVVPSTIEEYQILLLIGNLIGEKNMPSLILPDPNGKRQIIN